MKGDDKRDFAAFFATEYPPLRRIAFLLTGDWHQADELAQDAMTRTYGAWARIRRRDQPAAYTRRVLVNRHRSLLRRALVEARHAFATEPKRHLQPDLSGDDQVLWEALWRLPGRHRRALVLRYYLDLPEAEVARCLGVPAGTVKSWTHRGLARLRARLGPQYGSAQLDSNREAAP